MTSPDSQRGTTVVNSRGKSGEPVPAGRHKRLRIVAALVGSFLPAMSASAASAIAYCQTTGHFGSSWGALTVDVASDKALARCRNTGGTDCQLIGANPNDGYFAVVRSGEGMLFALGQPSDVSAELMKQCQQQATDCRLLVSRKDPHTDLTQR